MTPMITREFGFDMGHMLPDHLGGCYRPHGHRYRGEVTITGDLMTNGAERGMVLDFGLMKKAIEQVVIDRYDHRFLVCTDDARAEGMRDVFSGDAGGCVFVSKPPTVENIAHWIGTDFIGYFEQYGCGVVSLRLWETPTCSTLWVPEGSQAFA